VLLFEERGAPRECAARAREVAEGGDPAGGLLPHLRGGVLVVRVEIAVVAKLIRMPRAAFRGEALGFPFDELHILAGDLPGHGVGSLIDEHHLRAQRLHHAGAFDAVTPAHHGDERMPQHAADDRQTGARVAAGQLNDRLTGLEFAGPQRIFDHLSGDAVFFGEARVEQFHLGDDAAGDAVVLRHAAEFDHRRAADGLGGVG
jgi:hypothetical protein